MSENNYLKPYTDKLNAAIINASAPGGQMTQLPHIVLL